MVHTPAGAAGVAGAWFTRTATLLQSHRGEITSQLSFLCFSGLHNVGLAGADTEATVD